MRIVSAIASAMVLAGSSSAIAEPPNYIPAELRASLAKQPVVVLLPSDELGSTVDRSHTKWYFFVGLMGLDSGILPAYAAGLLLDREINHESRNFAEKFIQPARASLNGFDVNLLAVKTTSAALARVPWLSRAPIEGASPEGPRTLERTSEPTLLYIYSYSLSPDYGTVRVFMTAEVVRGVNPEAIRNPSYRQRLEVDVRLPSASSIRSENIDQWSDDHGRLLRQALRQAFERVGEATPALMTDDSDDARAIRGKSNAISLGRQYYLSIDDRSRERLYFQRIRHRLVISELLALDPT